MHTSDWQQKQIQGTSIVKKEQHAALYNQMTALSFTSNPDMASLLDLKWSHVNIHCLPAILTGLATSKGRSAERGNYKQLCDVRGSYPTTGKLLQSTQRARVIGS